MFYVNVYRTAREYGGPEEGGWYYSTGQFLGSEGGYSKIEDAWAKRDRVNRSKYNGNLKGYSMGHGPHDGADPDGNGDDNYLMVGGEWGADDIEIYIEEHTGRSFPTERPYYS